MVNDKNDDSQINKLSINSLPPEKKRKKSVHFPENHVIPIDSSSYSNQLSENSVELK